jgi:hypothetical protein
MVLIIEFWYRNNQQTMILAGVTVYKGRTAISTRAIGPE